MTDLDKFAAHTYRSLPDRTHLVPFGAIELIYKAQYATYSNSQTFDRFYSETNSDTIATKRATVLLLVAQIRAFGLYHCYSQSMINWAVQVAWSQFYMRYCAIESTGKSLDDKIVIVNVEEIK